MIAPSYHRTSTSLLNVEYLEWNPEGQHTANDDAQSTQTVIVIFTQKFPTGQPKTQPNPAAASATSIQSFLSVCLKGFTTMFGSGDSGGCGHRR